MTSHLFQWHRLTRALLKCRNTQQVSSYIVVVFPLNSRCVVVVAAGAVVTPVETALDDDNHDGDFVSAGLFAFFFFFFFFFCVPQLYLGFTTFG